MTDTPDIWRLGDPNLLHVYETTNERRPVATFFRPEDAERAVKAVNGAFYDPTERDEARYVSEQLTAVHRVLHDGFPDVVDNVNPVKMARDVVQHARTLRAEVRRLNEDRGDVEVWMQRIAAAAGVHQDELTDEAVKAACDEFQQNRRRVRDLELELERFSVAASGVTDASAAAADMWRQTAATNKKLADEWMASAMREIQENATVRRDLHALRDQVAAAPTMPSDLPVVKSIETLPRYTKDERHKVEFVDGEAIYSAPHRAKLLIAAGMALLAAEAAKPDPVEELARVMAEGDGSVWADLDSYVRNTYLTLAGIAIAWTEKRDA